MKKTVLISILILTGLLLNAQVTSVELISKKTYENQTQTSYILLSGYIPLYLTNDLAGHIESLPDIERFSFYDSSNYKKCMFTAASSFEINNIANIINDFLLQFEDFNTSDDLLNTKYFENCKAVKFFVSGIEDDLIKEEIIAGIPMNEGIISIEILPDNNCKLTLSKNISKQYIIEIFESHNLSIVEIHNN